MNTNTIASMSSSSRQFHAQALPTIIMVLLVPLFSGLGLWQLDRAEQKRNLASLQDTRRKMPPLSLNNGIPGVDNISFRRVSAEGEYLFDKSILIENRKHLGKSGFHLITPLKLNGSDDIILVNRGWLSIDQFNRLETLTSADSHVSIQGKIHIPQPPALELGQPDIASQKTPRWPYLTLENYRAWSGLNIAPFAILQTAEDDDAFVRQWPEERFSDGMHVGYAIQWFAFALISILIWWRLSLRPINQGVKA